MITPSHIIYNWAAARSLDRKLGESTTRVHGMVLGGLLPDIPAYSFFFFYTFVVGASQREMWDHLYFETSFYPFVTIFHSLWLWPVLTAVGYALGRQWLLWLAAGSTLHVVLDFFTHNDDAVRHFWPFTDWKFMSPVSYWDPQHYGNIVGTIDTIVILLLLWWLTKKYTDTRRRWLIYGVALLYFLMTVLPPIIFSLN